LDLGVDGLRKAVIAAPPKTGGFRTGADRQVPSRDSRAEFIREFSVSPNLAPWPKAPVTLVPPAINIDFELRQAGGWNGGSPEEVLDLLSVSPVGIASADALHAQSQ
jgi:hypothetical protein